MKSNFLVARPGVTEDELVTLTDTAPTFPSVLITPTRSVIQVPFSLTLYSAAVNDNFPADISFLTNFFTVSFITLSITFRA